MLNAPRTGLKAGLAVWKAMARNPLKVAHYLYFRANANITTDGGAVSAWTDAGLSTLTRSLAQGTGSLQPAHDTSDDHITFDSADDKLVFNSAVEQAGVLVVATSNGIFAYEVDADSVDEITALGWEKGYFQGIDLYAYILFTTAITDVELAGVIRYLEEDTNATKNPTGNLTNYFRNRADLVTPKFDALDFGGVTAIPLAWMDCGSLTSFPSVDLSSATDFRNTWNNTALTTFPALTFSTDGDDDIRFDSAWQGCTSLTSFPALNLSRGTNFSNTWQDCTGLTSFPAATFSTHADDDVNFNSTWRACTGLTSFPALNLSRGTYFGSAWRGCSNASFTSFPAVTFSTHADDDLNFLNAWNDCRFTSFPALNLSRGTNFEGAWTGNTAMTSFGACTFSTTASDDINFSQAWRSCTALTSFPALNLSRGTDFNSTWNGCNSMTSFLATGLDSGTTFTYAWYGCTALTTFPAIPLTAGTTFRYAWTSCTSMTSFLATGLDSATDFYYAWYGCTALTTFPAIPLTAGTNFHQTWRNCTSMISFNATGMNLGAEFFWAWKGCTALTTFPAGVFDDWNPASVAANCFDNTWNNCTALTEQSVENILLSISASGVHATTDGTANTAAIAGKEITIDSNNVNVDNLTPATRAACTALQSRGWEVVINGSVVSEYALSFNGTDEHVEITGTSFPTGTANRTIAGWVRWDDTTDVSGVFGYGTGSPSARQVFEFYHYGASGIRLHYSSDNSGGSTALSNDTWYHLVGTYDGTTAKVYINGILDHTDTVALGTVADFWRTGCVNYSASPSEFFGGDIDEVAVWDVALDADAVAAVYNSGSPINLNQNKGNYDEYTDDLVSWWRMGDNDSGAGDFVTDVIATDGEALHLPGINSNNASTPHTTALAIAGDLELIVNCEQGVADSEYLVTKYSGSSRGYALLLLATGKFRYYRGTGSGSDVSTDSSAAIDSTKTWFKMTHRVSDDRVQFFQSDDGDTWAQLGTDKTISTLVWGGGTEDVFVGTDGVGSYPFNGKIQRAIIKDGIDGTTVLDANFTLANKGVTSFTATSGQEVTINSTAIANPAAIRSATDGVLVNSPTFVVDNPPNYSNYSMEFDGTDDAVTVGDAGLITSAGTISIWVKAQEWANYDNAFDTGNGVINTGIRLEAGPTPYLYIYYATDGAGSVASGALDYTAVDGQWGHIAVTWSGSTIKGYTNGIETFSATNLYTSFVANVLAFGVGFVNRYFEGSIDEAAIWTSTLTSAQINDIYNGGVPADLTSLSPIGWWRFGENDSGAGTTITDEGSGENDGTLVSVPTFSRSVPAEDATWNNRSILFNGTDQSMTTTADDTLATKSYSFWAKSDETGHNGVFDHGGATTGAFSFNHTSNKPILYMGSAYYRYWADNSAQDDDAWHFWTVVIHPDISDCLLYCDGVLQTVDSTGSSGTVNDYTTGILIGKTGSQEFDGSLDEFAVFDGELTPAQVLQIYNGGSPADLKEFSPDSWWRMGDDDDAGGTTIRDLGVVSTTELVSNGEFGANTTGWTAGTSATLSSEGGRLKIANEASTNHGYANQEVTVVVGARYKVTADLVFSAGNATDVQFKLGTTSEGVEYYNSGDITADTTITQYITATTTSLFVQCQNSGNAATNAYFDNVSVKQDDLVLNGDFSINSVPDTWNGSAPVNLVGWTSGGAAFTADAHFVITDGRCRLISDGTNTVINSGTVVVGKTYQYSLEVTDVTTGGLTPIGGGVVLEANITSTGIYSGVFTAVGTTAMSINRQSGTTDITFDNISVQEIDGNTGTLVNSPTFSTDIP